MSKWLEEAKEGDAVILRPLRKQLLVASDVEDLHAAAIERLEDGTRKLVINLSSASYLSSAALGTLVGLHVSYSRRGGRVHLCHCGSQLKLLLDITKANSVLSVYEDVSEALAAF